MNNKKIYLVIFFLLSMGACDFLDYNEQDFHREEDIFKNFERTRDFLDATYMHLPTGFNSIDNEAMRASASDDAEEANTLSDVQSMNDGRWSANRPVDPMWLEMYEGIRAANRLLENLDISNMDDRRFNDDYPEQVEQYELFDEQARFLRAYFYFELMRRYGGVPILDGDVPTLENVNDITPNTLQEVKDYIVTELNAIIPELPVDYSDITGGPHEGRANKGAALALKSRVLLYAASPLYDANTSWAEAAEAAWQVIQMDTVYELEGDYEDVVNNAESDELIFGRRFEPENDFERSNFPVGYEGASPGTLPTQNLVNTYEMINGLDIDEAGSGYDPQNPYQDRDPRLSKTIIYNNSEWKDRNVELWRGGQDGLPKELASRTGYYLKKYVEEDVSLDPNSPSSANHLWVFIRYAEMYLNYAEAMNEAYGPQSSDPEGYGMTAVEALNVIRDRAGLPDYAGAMTQEAVREQIRDERRVELAFENHRFWDLRRWEIGDQTDEIYAMEITRNADETFTYNKVLLENRNWQPKLYWYPVPQTELFKNNNLQQNPNW